MGELIITKLITASIIFVILYTIAIIITYKITKIQDIVYLFSILVKTIIIYLTTITIITKIL